MAAHVRKSRQDPASKTALPTVDAGLAAQAPQIILGQEFLAHGGVDMVPWQGFVNWPLAVRIEIGFKADETECFQPKVVAKKFFPGIKLNASLPGLVDDFSHAPVSAR